MTKNKVIDFTRPMTVGEVAKRSGVPISTIHFYETKGLISSVRTLGNQRRFPSVVLRYIAIIKTAQRMGISLDEIRRMFSQFEPDSPLSGAQWRAMTSQWRDELNYRIKMLARLRDELDSCIGCGCLSLEECPLRNPSDQLGEQGSGARILDRE